MLFAAPPPTPVLEADKPCYVSAQTTPGTFAPESMTISGSGLQAFGSVDLAVDDTTVLSGVPIAADGTLAPQVLTAPTIAAGERRVAISARSATGDQATGTFVRVTALAVRVRPKRARPQQVVRIAGRGFTDRAPIYAHYVRKGKVRRTVRLAAQPKGACGRFSVTRPQFPFRPRTGVWRVQVDQHPELTTDGPLVDLSVDVKRRPVTQRASG